MQMITKFNIRNNGQVTLATTQDDQLFPSSQSQEQNDSSRDKKSKQTSLTSITVFQNKSETAISIWNEKYPFITLRMSVNWDFFSSVALQS